MFRRRLLATTCAAGGGLVAGCAAPTDSGSTDGSLPVGVTNRTAESQSISVTVADTDGEVVERVAADSVGADVSETFESAGYRGATRTPSASAVTTGRPAAGGTARRAPTTCSRRFSRTTSRP